MYLLIIGAKLQLIEKHIANKNHICQDIIYLQLMKAFFKTIKIKISYFILLFFAYLHK
jgi:hypothetical protein